MYVAGIVDTSTLPLACISILYIPHGAVGYTAGLVYSVQSHYGVWGTEGATASPTVVLEIFAGIKLCDSW